MKLKLVSMLAMGSLLIGSLAGCASSNASSSANENTVSQETNHENTNARQGEHAIEGEVTKETSQAGQRVIVDQAGNEVVLPEKIERVVITSLWPLPSVYCLFQGSGEGLVGMHPAAQSAAENSMLNKVADLSGVETGFIQDGQINIEELMKLNPDVVFYSSANTEEYEILKKAGIPAVGFTANPTGDGNTIEAVSSWMRQLGEVFDKEDRAEEVMTVGYEMLSEVQERIGEIKEEDKERILILYRYSEDEISVAGTGHFGDYWINSVGGINVAAEIKGTQVVNMEQIYAWNPDKIFITNFSATLPEDIYNNAFEGYDWSSVKAVQEQEVYKIPLGMYRWYPPSSDTPLMLKWLAKKVYPKLFEDIDMNQEVKDYFKQFYDVELTDEEVETIFNPTREAANGV